MDQIKGIKVNGVPYGLQLGNTTGVETHLVAPDGTDFIVRIDNNGGIYGVADGKNDSAAPYNYSGTSGDSVSMSDVSAAITEALKDYQSGGSISSTEIELTDVYDNTRKYFVTVADGTLRVQEITGVKLIGTTTISQEKADATIGASALVSLVINEVYANDTAEYLANPEHNIKVPVSHNFIEIGNYTDSDIDLDNIYLYYLDKASSDEDSSWKQLKLHGTIKSFSTFLVRGAQVASMKSPTTTLKVDTFDMEWFDNGLPIAFNNDAGAIYLSNSSTAPDKNPGANVGKKTGSSVPADYLDLFGWGSSKAYEKAAFSNTGSNIVFVRRNMLDRATQSNKALAKRSNTAGNTMDCIYADKHFLGNEADYKPMASYENKNLYTTRSDFRGNTPYCVTVTFGIHPENTRCFNWISNNPEDEYLFYRVKGTTKWIIKKDYAAGDGQDLTLRTTTISANDTTKDVVLDVYDRYTWETSGHRFVTTHKVILKDNVTTDINGNKTPLTSDLKYYTDYTLTTESASETDFTKGKVYEYVVGQAEKDTFGNITGPKSGACSPVYEFQVRPRLTGKKWSFVQHSDQQGFHPSEYQVWRRTADIIRAQFNPQFTINTGDMTQNGNRVNEWIDYNNAASNITNGLEFTKTLADGVYHNYSAGVEQMNVIGNNDLSPVLTYMQSNGDEASDKDKLEDGVKGKASVGQFNFYYTYEIDPTCFPYVTLADGSIKVIPSCYSFTYNDCHFVAIDSEITAAFAITQLNDSNYKVTNDKIEAWVVADLKKNYANAKNANTDVDKDAKWCIAYMHEMPYTILIWGAAEEEGGTRAGSKPNTNASLQFHMSEIFQDYHVRMILCGHKHTHSESWPIFENITYEKNDVSHEVKYSWELDGDDFYTSDTYFRKPNSKKPLVILPNNVSKEFATKFRNARNGVKGTGVKFPERINKNCEGIYVTKAGHVDWAPVYVMSQSSGNKVISNKEKPSASIPWLHYSYQCSGTSKDTEKVLPNQCFPHFIRYEFNYDTSGNPKDIEIAHYKVNKDDFCNFVTTQKFYHAGTAQEGQLENTDPLATKSDMTDIIGNPLGDFTKVEYTDTFPSDFYMTLDEFLAS